MTVQNGKYSARADHRRHDRLLVTRHAMDDSYPGERDEARQLIATCADCAKLAADIRVIASSMNQLPAHTRPRDFTISQEQADRLRGSRLSRLLRGLAAPGWATLRPVAGVALSIGLVMAVAGSVLPTSAPAAYPDGGAAERTQTFGAPTVDGAPAQEDAATPPPVRAPVATAAPAASSLSAPAASTLVPAEADPDSLGPNRGGTPGSQPPAQATKNPSTESLDTAYLQEASPETVVAESDGDDGFAATQLPPADPTRNLLIYGGLALALISLALLVLAWTARRYFADPLLR